ncbi:MAG: GNAT family N-acetyltransferase, partial [Gammaproteobacteria bacterium]|nr:GNAT family N-acetyltransferase [Gammaproteobacteria bacterium]
RKKGYGKALMSELLKYSAQHFPGIGIQCSAQYRLKAFYESFGFEALGDIYLEDEIQHIAMRKLAGCSVNKNQ